MNMPLKWSPGDLNGVLCIGQPNFGGRMLVVSMRKIMSYFAFWLTFFRTVKKPLCLLWLPLILVNTYATIPEGSSKWQHNDCSLLTIKIMSEFYSCYLDFSVIEQLGGKQTVMQLLAHDDPNVRYEALLAVQKLMVHNWYDLNMYSAWNLFFNIFWPQGGRT